MGNPNIYWIFWKQMSSIPNATTLNVPFKDGNPITFFGATHGARQVTNRDTVEVHEITLIETGAGFPNPIPSTPTINVDFEVNGSGYYRWVWQSRVTPRQKIDFNVIGSNLGGGSAPLLLTGGDTISFRMVDGARPDNSNRYRIEAQMWGLRLGV